MSKEFECNNCGSTVKWPEEFKKGDGPVNMDGSKHNCIQTEGAPEPELEPGLIDTSEPLYSEPYSGKTCPFSNHNPCKTSCALYLAGEINCCAFLLRVKK